MTAKNFANLSPEIRRIWSKSLYDQIRIERLQRIIWIGRIMPKHTCHAEGCSELVPPTMLMCKRHWRMVPRQLRLGVWRWYRPGQELEKNPTRQYLAAANSAIKAVAEKERERAAKIAAKHPEFDFGPEPE